MIYRMLKISWLSFALLLMLGLGSRVAMALTATASPATCENLTGIGSVAWSNPSYAEVSDNSRATASVDGTTTQYLYCHGYGFSIPTGATINGITVNVERSSNSTSNSGSKDAAVRVVQGGVVGTTDNSSGNTYTTSDVVEAHGGDTDLWGKTWTAAQINAANFGTAFAATKASSSGSAQTVSVNSLQVTVDYTPPPLSCTPPSNIPSGVSVSCVCDNFGRTSLNPSTIFGSNWIVSTSDSTGILPYINATTGLLRLTENTGGNAKAATVPGIFPAAGNYISVEFRHYAYTGSGADGIAVTLSDFSVPAVPGAFGGSLGYAQKSNPGSDCTTAGGCPGFAAGWVGIALDEYGNYQNPTEGRIGGPGAIADSVAVRGSGSGQNGYQWLQGTSSSLFPGIDNTSANSPNPGYLYQVIVDSRNSAKGQAFVAVNRDTTGTGASYGAVINPFDVFARANTLGFTQSPVPANWQISFTGSTGGATNIHEIGSLRICAQQVFPPSGGTANGFNAIDDAYGTPPSVAVQNYLNGHIYMKVVGKPFNLDVAALNNSQISTGYGGVSGQPVTVNLVDNSDGVCILDSSKTGYCSSACTNKAPVAACPALPGNKCSQTMTMKVGNSGQLQFQGFNVNAAYKNLVAIITGGGVNACSTDSFSVRPQNISGVTTTTATQAGAPPATPVVKAGAPFDMSAVIDAPGYTGTPKINTAAVTVFPTGGVLGSFSPTSFPAAVSGATSSTATGSAFTYSEVGNFQFLGYDPSIDAVSPRGVFDGVATATECPNNVPPCDTLLAATWTGADSVSTKGDCVLDSYANTANSSGKYGCNFGLNNSGAGGPNSSVFGRFIPDHFDVTAAALTNRSDLSCTSQNTDGFTYMGEPLGVTFSLAARNATGSSTQNYDFAKGYSRLTIAAGYWIGAQGPSPLSSNNLNLWPLDNPASPAAKTIFPLAAGRVGFAGATASTTCTGSPVNRWCSGMANFAGTFTLARAAAPDGPYNYFTLGIAPQDADGVTLASSALNVDADQSGTAERASVGVSSERFGILKLGTAYGSELLPLTVAMETRYWNGTGFILNTDDNCTGLAASNIAAALISSSSGTTLSAPAVMGISKGRGSLLVFTTPKVRSTFRICADISGDTSCAATTSALSYLTGRWDGSANYDRDPSARAAFGLNRGTHLYYRESY